MIGYRGSVFVLLLILGNFTQSEAQFSWKAKRYPECRSFAVTDFQALIRLSPTPYQELRFFRYDTLEAVERHSLKGKVSLISDLGLMRNLNTHYAIGLSHIMAVNFGGEDGFYGGFKLRLRRWLNKKSSIEVSPGLLIWGRNIGGMFERPGLAGSIDFRWREAMGISLYVEYLQAKNWDSTGGEFGSTERTDNDLGVYFGGRFGSIPGLIANGAGLASLGVAILIFLIGYSGY